LYYICEEEEMVALAALGLGRALGATATGKDSNEGESARSITDESRDLQRSGGPLSREVHVADDGDGIGDEKRLQKKIKTIRHK
jgi:hypothetical protein